jgi:hypothetical protein
MQQNLKAGSAGKFDPQIIAGYGLFLQVFMAS